MQLPQIRLQSNFMKIGLNIEQPVQEIEQPKAIQSIEQPKAIVEIQTTPGKLTIDQSEARADMDLKSIAVRIRELSQNGYQDGLEGTKRRVIEGEQLMQIEHKGNPIAEQAKANSEGPEKQFNLGWIPSHFSVKLQYEPTKVNIHVEPQKPIIHTEVQRPIHNYLPGKTTVEVLERNNLEIDFINLFPEKSK